MPLRISVRDPHKLVNTPCVFPAPTIEQPRDRPVPIPEVIDARSEIRRQVPRIGSRPSPLLGGWHVVVAVHPPMEHPLVQPRLGANGGQEAKHGGDREGEGRAGDACCV